jgi:hypothetical protein
MDMWTQLHRETHHEIRKRYPSDLSDEEWALTIPFFAGYQSLSLALLRDSASPRTRVVAYNSLS